MSEKNESFGSTANVSKEDDELSQLLDSSLHEFGKSNLNLSTSDDVTDNMTADEEFDAEAARKAASEFASMLQQLTEVQKYVVEQMSADLKTDSAENVTDNKPLSDSSSSDHLPGTSDQEDLQFAQTFVKSMEYLTEKAQKIQDAKTEEQFVEAMKHLSDDESYENDFMPFMQGLMGSLLCKDMLYPPMKDMCDKFPAWLAENKVKLDESTVANYEKQIKLMQDICGEFEGEKPDETEQEKSQRFDRLVLYLQKMQACGHPPEELIGSLPPGWRFDNASGLPQVVEPERAAETCCLM